MNIENIDALLEKYWDGQTSLEEERRLKRYFNGTEINEKHLPFRDLFVAQEDMDIPILGDDFDQLILQEIKTDTPVRSLPKRSFTNILKYAAAILFFGVGIFLFQQNLKSDQLANSEFLIVNGKKYYPADEKEAYELTKQALLLVSTKMKKSETGIKEIKQLENISRIN